MPDALRAIMGNRLFVTLAVIMALLAIYIEIVSAISATNQAIVSTWDAKKAKLASCEQRYQSVLHRNNRESREMKQYQIDCADMLDEPKRKKSAADLSDQQIVAQFESIDARFTEITGIQQPSPELKLCVYRAALDLLNKGGGLPDELAVKLTAPTCQGKPIAATEPRK